MLSLAAKFCFDSNSCEYHFQSNLTLLRWTRLHGELHLVASVETWSSSGSRSVGLRRRGGRWQKSCNWRWSPGCHAWHQWCCSWYSYSKTGCGWPEAPWKVASSEVSAVRCWGVGFVGSRFAVLEGFEFPGLGRCQRVKMSAPRGTFRQVQRALWSQKMNKIMIWICYELIWDNILLYTMLHTLLYLYPLAHLQVIYENFWSHSIFPYFSFHFILTATI